MSGLASPVPEQDVVAFLAAVSAGGSWPVGVPALVSGANLFASVELPSVPSGVGVPSQAVFVTPYGGEPPDLYMGAVGVAGSVRWAAIQVMVRSNPGDRPGSLALARAIRDALPRQEVALSAGASTPYFWVTTRQAEPLPLGLDGQNRWRWSVNFKLGYYAQP